MFDDQSLSIQFLVPMVSPSRASLLYAYGLAFGGPLSAVAYSAHPALGMSAAALCLGLVALRARVSPGLAILSFHEDGVRMALDEADRPRARDWGVDFEGRFHPWEEVAPVRHGQWLERRRADTGHFRNGRVIEQVIVEDAVGVLEVSLLGGEQLLSLPLSDATRRPAARIAERANTLRDEALRPAWAAR